MKEETYDVEQCLFDDLRYGDLLELINLEAAKLKTMFNRGGYDNEAKAQLSAVYRSIKTIGDTWEQGTYIQTWLRSS